MRSEHDFVVGGNVEDVWRELLDIETFVRCFPGVSASEVRAADIEGRLTMKVGPIGFRIEGAAEYAETDHDALRLVVQARGKDSRLGLDVDATIVVTLDESEHGAIGRAATDVRATGVPTSLAHGLLTELGHDLWEEFAECLGDTVQPERLLPEEDQPRPPLPEKELPPEFKPGRSETLSDEVARILDDGDPDDPVRPEDSARSAPRPETDPEINLLGAAPGPIVRRLRRRAKSPVAWMNRLRRQRDE